MEKMIPFYNVASEVTRKDGSNNGIWNHQDRIDTSKEIIIGFSPTNYHTFIICGDQEFHPRFAFNKGRLAKARRRSIRAGLFIRLTGIDSQTHEKFRQYLKSIKGKRTPSCHLGALQILESGAGIKLVQSNNKRLKPKEFMLHAFKYGFTHNGRMINSLAYTTRDKSLTDILSDVESFQNHFKWAYILSDITYFFIRRLSPNSLVRHK
jgi:hypothetical protein